LSLGKKKFVQEAFYTNCWCQKQFFKIFAVLGTLKLSKILNSLRACSDLYAHGSGAHAHAERARQELMHALNIRVRNWCMR
jgi:hypothetical protein